MRTVTTMRTVTISWTIARIAEAIRGAGRRIGVGWGRGDSAGDTRGDRGSRERHAGASAPANSPAPATRAAMAAGSSGRLGREQQHSARLAGWPGRGEPQAGAVRVGGFAPVVERLE